MALGPWDQAFRFQEAVMEKKKKKEAVMGKSKALALWRQLLEGPLLAHFLSSVFMFFLG